MPDRTAPASALVSDTPPKPRLSLGWRLALSLSLMVTVVMGGITLPQRFREINARKHAHVAALRAALAPLVAEIEAAPRPEALVDAVRAFHIAYLKQGHTDHQLALTNLRDRVLVSTLPDGGLPGPSLFHVAVPVTSRAIAGGHGTLAAAEDGAAFRSGVRRLWADWARHMILTVAAILLFMLPAVRYFVTRPIERLLDEIGQMEKGYWSRRPLPKGAWEIRWLAWRFRNLGLELQNTVERLVTAERRAHAAGIRRQAEPDEFKPVEYPADVGVGVATGLRDRLRLLCLELEATEPQLPSARARAEDGLAHALEADRYGLHDLKARLENAALRILEPSGFRHLDERLQAMIRRNEAWRKEVEHRLRAALDTQRVPFQDLRFRLKHTAGVLKKMRTQHLDLEQIHDLFAFRVVVPTESDCYWALGVVHQAFRPVVSRFKDYIAHPKDNGYQSLHTSVRHADGPVFEVQIRSVTMHRYAEQGEAAHWAYKKSQAETLPSEGPGRSPIGLSGRRLIETLHRLRP